MVVLSIEACRLFREVTVGIPVSGLLAKCLLVRLRSII